MKYVAALQSIVSFTLPHCLQLMFMELKLKHYEALLINTLLLHISEYLNH